MPIPLGNMIKINPIQNANGNTDAVTSQYFDASGSKLDTNSKKAMP